ncbi:MAG: transposase [Gammaproteobacteria bacterium]|nr:transposase [Gammaproteobacteria bacterium]
MSTEKRGRYTAEFRREAARLITEHGYKMSQATRNQEVNANM